MTLQSSFCGTKNINESNTTHTHKTKRGAKRFISNHTYKMNSLQNQKAEREWYRLQAYAETGCKKIACFAPFFVRTSSYTQFYQKCLFTKQTGGQQEKKKRGKDEEEKKHLFIRGRIQTMCFYKTKKDRERVLASHKRQQVCVCLRARERERWGKGIVQTKCQLDLRFKKRPNRKRIKMRDTNPTDSHTPK
jgi:hypothetical protein